MEVITDNLTFAEISPQREKFAVFVDPKFPNGPDHIRFAEAEGFNPEFPKLARTLASVRVTDSGYSVRNYAGTEVSEETTPEAALQVVQDVIRDRLPKARQERLARLSAAERRVERGASIRAIIRKRAWATEQSDFREEANTLTKSAAAD